MKILALLERWMLLLTEVSKPRPKEGVQELITQFAEISQLLRASFDEAQLGVILPPETAKILNTASDKFAVLLQSLSQGKSPKDQAIAFSRSQIWSQIDPVRQYLRKLPAAQTRAESERGTVRSASVWASGNSKHELKLIVDAGSAPPEVIAELLADFSKLYRRIGGNGIRFEVSDATVREGAFT